MKKAAIIFLSILLTLLGAEIAYRFKLYHGRRLPDRAPSYTVYNDSICEYSRRFGYKYVPGKKYVAVQIKDGYPVRRHTGSINKFGNMGIPKENYEKADLKILVFGNSFTAVQHGGVTWPDLLQRALEVRLSKRVSVINFGRDGYGVLQMFDLASSKVAEFKPDLAIIAFITADLTRARFWRTVNYINGEKRLLTSVEPRRKVDSKTSTDTTMLNPLVTDEWYESMLASRKTDDPLLKKINRQFLELKRKNSFPINLTSVSTSFLFNRIFHGHPFRNLVKPSRNPRLDFKDYGDDRQFMHDVDLLNRQNVPYYIVHVPEYSELKANKYIVGSHQEALLGSLRKITGKEIISLLKYNTAQGERLEELFLLPNDEHPSLRGLEFYANAVSEELGYAGN